MFHEELPFIAFGNTWGYTPFESEKRIGVVRPGFYDTVENLTNEIELEMTTFKSAEIKYLPKFSYDNVTKMITIKPGLREDGVELLPHMNREILEILGFSIFNFLYFSSFGLFVIFFTIVRTIFERLIPSSEFSFEAIILHIRLNVIS